MPALNTRQVLRTSLARYSAMSASRNRSAGATSACAAGGQDADAGGDVDLVGAQLEALGQQRRRCAPPDVSASLLEICGGQMITNSSPPRRTTRSPERTLRARRSADQAQQVVARVVAEVVVDELEPVEVDIQHRELPLAGIAVQQATAGARSAQPRLNSPVRWSRVACCCRLWWAARARDWARLFSCSRRAIRSTMTTLTRSSRSRPRDPSGGRPSTRRKQVQRTPADASAIARNTSRVAWSSWRPPRWRARRAGDVAGCSGRRGRQQVRHRVGEVAHRDVGGVVADSRGRRRRSAAYIAANAPTISTSGVPRRPGESNSHAMPPSSGTSSIA